MAVFTIGKEQLNELIRLYTHRDSRTGNCTSLLLLNLLILKEKDGVVSMRRIDLRRESTMALIAKQYEWSFILSSWARHAR